MKFHNYESHILSQWFKKSIAEQFIFHSYLLSITSKQSFDFWSSQKCKYLFINARFRGKNLTWKQISKYSLEYERYGIGPSLFPTDYGACCTLIPHLDFEKIDKNKSIEEIYHLLEADAKNGESHGLDIVLNAEEFNYGSYHQANGAGFKESTFI